MSSNETKRLETAMNNWRDALKALEKSLSTPVAEPRDLSGIIKDFEMVYELSWKTLKKFLEKEGHETGSAKQTFSLAFQLGFIDKDELWSEIIKDRNLTVHTYNERFAREMCDRIRAQYFSELSKLYQSIRKQGSSKGKRRSRS